MHKSSFHNTSHFAVKVYKNFLSKMRRAIIFSFFCIFFQISTSSKISELTPEQVQEIENLFQESLVNPEDSPGLGYSISTTDSILHAGGKGYKDLNNSGDPADQNTRFLIGSVTKSFTATLAVKLLSEKFPQLGEKVLDTPISKLMPEYGFILRDRLRTDTITFRDLLAHRTCQSQGVIESLAGVYDGVDDYVFRQRYAEESCAIRSKMVYNNGLYTMAGHLLAFLGNSTFEQFMREHIFNPLGMEETQFTSEVETLTDIPFLAKPYLVKGMNASAVALKPEWIQEFGNLVSPAGGIVSSPADMAKYIQFHLNQGKIGENLQLIPPQVLEWLYTPSMLFPELYQPLPGYRVDDNDVAELDINYGLGLVNGIYDGYKKISHDGFLPPYLTYFSLYPDLGLGIFTSTSGFGALNTGMNVLHSKVVDIVKGITRLPSNNSTNAKNEPKIPENSGVIDGPLPSLETFIGHYGSLFSGDFNVTLRNRTTISGNEEESLWLHYGRWGQGWLILPSLELTGFQFKIDIQTDFSQLFQYFLPSLESENGLTVEFQRDRHLASIYFRGFENMNMEFRKGFNSTHFINEHKHLPPWELHYEMI